MRRWQDGLQIANLVVLGVLAWMLFGGLPEIVRWRFGPETPKRPEAFDWVDPAKGLKIIMFYGTPPVLLKGETASICFGVQNAASVRIEPPIATLRPTLNRCLEASPAADTRYTLTARDASGHEVSESFVLKVSRPAAPAPRIEYFRVDQSSSTKDGKLYKLCFAASNAELVSIEPPAFPPRKLALGCFPALPTKATGYTLTVTGAGGRQVSKSLTIAP